MRRANPKKFQNMYELVKEKLTTPFPSRAKVVRNFSLEASRLVPDSSLDFVYIDGRHDLAGVTEDLTAWWPKLCPGGLLGGHDWIGHGDASLAVKGWASALSDPRQPKHIYISAPQLVESAIYPVGGRRPICLPAPSKGSGRPYAPQSAA